MATVTIVEPVVDPKKSYITDDFVLEVTFEDGSPAAHIGYHLTAYVYYQDASFEQLMELSVGPTPGTYSINVPKPPKNAPFYGQLFGILVNLNTDDIPILNINVDTGLAFISQVQGFTPFRPTYSQLQAAQQEEQNGYWDYKPPAVGPTTSPPGKPPPDFPKKPWNGGSADRPPEPDAA